MKKWILVLIFAVAQLASSFAFAQNTDIQSEGPYVVSITVSDLSGCEVELTNASFFIKCGNNLAWGKKRSLGGYGLRNLDIEQNTYEIRIYSQEYNDIYFILSCDNGDNVYYISDTIKKEELSGSFVLKKLYKMSDMMKIDLNINFMGTDSGRYEVSIYRPEHTHIEADNRGSTFVMNNGDTKKLYISQGKYNFLFKYLDKGVCALAFRDGVDTSEVKNFQITQKDVDLRRYFYRTPVTLQDYKYYIMNVYLDNYAFTARLGGLFSNSGTLVFYMDKRILPKAQSLIFSKDPNDEYISSVYPIFQANIPVSLGNYFSPGDLSAFETNDGKWAFSIFFDDVMGNTVRFIDLPKKNDMVLEICDKNSGETLHKLNVSRYWDYLDINLKEGTYLVKVYPAENVKEVRGCTYYDLEVGDGYKFTRLYTKGRF
jgi:hypothetical protein